MNLAAYMQQYASRFPSLIAGASQAAAMPQQNLGAPQSPPAAAAAPSMGGLEPQQQAQPPVSGAPQPMGQPAQQAPAPMQNLAASMPQQQEEMTPEARAVSGDGEDSFVAHFNKQPEKVQNQQIADFQKQVKDIDSAYENYTKQMGQRPDTGLSRKEKALLLMEFGLQLMAASSGSAHGGDIGGALGDAGMKTLGSYRGQMEGKKADGEAWDTGQMNLRAAHDKEVASLTKDFRTEQRDERRYNLDQDRLDQTNRRLDQTDASLAALNADRAERNKDRDADRNQRAIEAMRRIGFSEAEAARRVADRGRDAASDLYRAVFSKVRDEKSLDPDNAGKADSEARTIVESVYGADALENLKRPATPATAPSSSAPPASVLKRGTNTTFKNGQVWTLGPDGKPKRVK